MHTMSISWVYNEYTTSLLQVYHEYAVSIPYHKSTISILQVYHIISIPWIYHEYTTSILQVYHIISIPWVYHEYTMSILWAYHEYTINIPWVYHKYTISIPYLCPWRRAIPLSWNHNSRYSRRNVAPRARNVLIIKASVKDVSLGFIFCSINIRSNLISFNILAVLGFFWEALVGRRSSRLCKILTGCQTCNIAQLSYLIKHLIYCSTAVLYNNYC